MTRTKSSDDSCEVLANRRSRNWLLLTGVILASAWLFIAILLAPAIDAPQPLTSLGTLFIFGGGFLLVSSKTPLAIRLGEQAVTFRHVLRRKAISRSQITRVEYRLLTSQVRKPVEERYYGVSIWCGNRRRADVALDGPIAKKLMNWFDPARSVLRIYEGGRIVGEHKVEPDTP